MVGTLRLFGVIHMDSLRKVTAELKPFVEESDGVFIEYPSSLPGLLTYLQLLLRVPMMLIGSFVVGLFFQYPLFVLFNRDLLPTEMAAVQRLQADQELAVHAIDDHPVLDQVSAGPAVIGLNWLVFVLALATAPLAGIVTAVAVLLAVLVPVLVRRNGYRRLAVALFVLALGGMGYVVVIGQFSVWLFLAGFGTWFVLAYATVDHRNEVMLDRVRSIAAEEGYEDTVLITGKAHLGGMARIAAERGMTVTKAHVSNWRTEGVTYTDVESGHLPEVGSGGIQISSAESGRPVLGRRLGAAVVDGVVLLFLATLGLLPASSIFESLGLAAVSPAIVLASSILSVGIGYYGLTEWRSGQTVGMRIFELAVVTEDDDRPGTVAHALRTVVLPIDLLLGLPLLLRGDPPRRLGDRLAGTVVRTVEREPVTIAEAPALANVTLSGRPSVSTDPEGSLTGARIKAGFVDLAVAGLLVAILTISTAVFVSFPVDGLTVADPGEFAEWLIAGEIAFGLLAYHAFFEWRYGATPGKYAEDIAVAGPDGEPLTGRQAIWRNWLRIADVLVGYLPSLVLIAIKDRSLGDFMTGTVVGRPDGLDSRDRSAGVDTARPATRQQPVGVLQSTDTGRPSGVRQPADSPQPSGVYRPADGPQPSGPTRSADGAQPSGVYRPPDSPQTTGGPQSPARPQPTGGPQSPARPQPTGGPQSPDSSKPTGGPGSPGGPQSTGATRSGHGQSTEPRTTPGRRYGVALGSEGSVFGRRVIAKVLDSALGAILAFVVLIFVALAIEIATGSRAAWKEPFEIVLLLTWFGTVTTYHTLLEYRYGTTAGKRLLGLGVADTDGGPVTWQAALLRNLLRPIDALACYAPGAFAIFVSRRSQRIGDHVSGTIVGKWTTEAAFESTAEDIGPRR